MVTLKHIRREGNKVADLLANMGVDCGMHLHVGSISRLAFVSQLLDFNNLVHKEMPHVDEVSPDAGGTRELNVPHAN